MLLLDIRHVLGTEFFVLQQDSAPAHTAKETVALLITDRDTLCYSAYVVAFELPGPQSC